MLTTALRLALAPALLLALAAPLAVAESSAQEEKRDVSHFNLDKKGVALAGYDPVAYFPEGGGKPAKGKADLALTYRGVTYRFATAANRAAFEKKPARFEPAYGGWCAYAMAQGEKVEIDPKSFLVTDGQLTVFYKGLFNDTRKKWLKKPGEYKPKADTAWAKVVAKKK